MFKFILSLMMLSVISLQAQKINFDKYFINKSLRMDYIHSGDATTSHIYPLAFHQDPFWGGSHTNLIDTFNYGKYRLIVKDSASNKTIYSRSFNSIFGEWQITPEAKKNTKAFGESIIMPFPKHSILIILQEADKKNIWHPLFSTFLSPNNMFIDKKLPYNFETTELINNGDPAKNLDIVILAEGYTASEMTKFIQDAKNLTNYLLNFEPFNQFKNKINVHLVKSISQESGTDIPGKNIWKSTILNTHFWTFGTERYLTTEDYIRVKEVAALAPYDQIFIIVNTNKYGGGGIFNFYNLAVSDNDEAKDVFVHEFGHGFGGLADEYGYSEPSNQSFYDLSVEPRAPNITTLVNFASKWKDMVADTIPVPTPPTARYLNTVGVFEGAGYLNKGIYRPQQNCLMRSLHNPYCKVCKKALIKMLKFYTE